LSAHRLSTPSLLLSRSLHSTPSCPERMGGVLSHLRHALEQTFSSTLLLPMASGLFCTMGARNPFSFQSLADSFPCNGGVPPLSLFSSTASSLISSISRRPSHFSSTAYKMLLPQLLSFDNHPFSWGCTPLAIFSKGQSSLSNPSHCIGEATVTEWA
jgi:hypothetical protein